MISYPYWWDTVSEGNREPGAPNLEPGTLNPEPPASCDVLVVGAGYTGLAASLALARSGASVVVIEREHAGWGASSRNGGQVLTGLKLEPAALVAQHGEARARALFDAAMASLSTLESVIQSL